MSCSHPTSRGPSPAMMEDGDWRRVCTVCYAAFEPTPDPEEVEHARHSALGENHWFTCPLCDDEDDGLFAPAMEMMSWDVYQPVL